MSLPLAEFYTHPQMADGHLGKCKACTRKDTADRFAAKSATDLGWVLAERERHRLKAERRRAEGTVAIPNHYLRTLKFRVAHPEKYAAHNAVATALKNGKLARKPCEICGKKAQAHHDDYSKPLDVRWLCVTHHMEHHRNERIEKIRAEFSK